MFVHLYVDYLHVQADNPWYNYYVAEQAGLSLTLSQTPSWWYNVGFLYLLLEIIAIDLATS